MADTGGHVLQAELIAVEPSELIDDAPGAREVRDVDLQAAWQAGARGVLSVAVSALAGRDAVAFVARASLFERPARCLREACQIGGEERVVEVDGSVVPSDLAGHRRSALVVGRQGRPEAPLELLDVGRAGGTAYVARVDLAHRVAVGRWLDLL